MSARYNPNELFSSELRRLTAVRLRENPALLALGPQTIARWTELRGRMAPAHQEWLRIIETGGLEEVLDILDGKKHPELLSARPFVGSPFVSDEERREIWARYHPATSASGPAQQRSL